MINPFGPSTGRVFIPYGCRDLIDVLFFQCPVLVKRYFPIHRISAVMKVLSFFKSSLCLYCNLYRCVATSDIATDCCYDNIAGYLGFLSVISQPWLVSQTVHVGVGWGGWGFWW